MLTPLEQTLFTSRDSLGEKYDWLEFPYWYEALEASDSVDRFSTFLKELEERDSLLSKYVLSHRQAFLDVLYAVTKAVSQEELGRAQERELRIRELRCGARAPLSDMHRPAHVPRQAPRQLPPAQPHGSLYHRCDYQRGARNVHAGRHKQDTLHHSRHNQEGGHQSKNEEAGYPWIDHVGRSRQKADAVKYLDTALKPCDHPKNAVASMNSRDRAQPAESRANNNAAHPNYRHDGPRMPSSSRQVGRSSKPRSQQPHTTAHKHKPAWRH